MVLIDTNVIIDIWKNADDDAAEVFKKEEVCICGVIRSELMHGARSEKNVNEISEKLDYLKEFNIKDEQWKEFGRFLYKIRVNGLTVPYADALIAFIALKNDIQIMTKDKHFKLIQVVEPLLKLYNDCI